MTPKEVATALGFETANKMFEHMGYEAKKFHKLKEESKQLKLCEIILNVHNLDTAEKLLAFISSSDNELFEKYTSVTKRLEEIHALSSKDGDL